MHDRDMYRRAAQEYEKKPVGTGGQDSDIVFVSEVSQLVTSPLGMGIIVSYT